MPPLPLLDAPLHPPLGILEVVYLEIYWRPSWGITTDPKTFELPGSHYLPGLG